MDKVWLKEKIEEYRKEKSNYELLAKKLAAILNVAKRRYAPLGHVTRRTKSVAGFAEKAVRKRFKENRYDNPLERMTDLAGARIVVNTLDEAREICRFFERDSEKEEEERCIWIDWENSLDTRKRMKISEFGYEAKHYVVELRMNSFEKVEIPPEIQSGSNRSYRGEIQIHTMCQNTWSLIGHDRLYKAKLKVPESIKREMYALAGALESDDMAFARCVETLDSYSRYFNAYKSLNELEDDIQMRKIICDNDKNDFDARHQLGRSLMAARKWDNAFKELSGIGKMDRADIQKDLGESAWRTGETEIAREHLKKACELEPENWQVYCLRGDTFRTPGDNSDSDGDLNDAIKSYEKALAIMPNEPAVMVPLAECYICKEKNLSKLKLLVGELEALGNKCHDRAVMGVYLPHAHFNCARMRLYRGKWYDALSAYTMAISSCHHPEPIFDELKALTSIIKAVHEFNKLGEGEELSEDKEEKRIFEDCLNDQKLQGYEWARRLLVVALYAKSLYWSEKERRKKPIANDWIEAGNSVKKKLEDLASPNWREKSKFVQPVVFVAGGCRPDIEDKLVSEYEGILRSTFKAFSGTIISGGTTSGISKMVGKLRPLKGRSLHRVGYLPDVLPDEDTQSLDYEIRKSPGPDYNPAGVIRAWADILLQKNRPDQVRILVINGGELTGFELRLGLALGAMVGAAEDSGRIVKTLLEVHNPCRPEGLVPLPRDPEIWSAFIRGSSPELENILSKPDVKKAAQYVHEQFCEECKDNESKHDASVLPWDVLCDEYKRSNFNQVQFAAMILDEFGYEIKRVPPGEKIDEKKPPLPPDYSKNITKMAKLEHGRFCAERFEAGWRYGKKKDLEKKLNPNLVPWKDVPRKIQKLDRDVVKNFPYWLAKADFKIVKRK